MSELAREPSTRRIRVVLCEDHPVYREGLALMLADLDGVEVVGEAATGTAALALLADRRPDVALMDLQLPDLSGVEVTRRALARDPALKVLVLTMHDDDASLAAALRAGARGYLLKGSGFDEVAGALATVARGDLLVTGEIAARLPALLADRRATGPLDALTPRERDVLELVAAGLDNATVAARLHLSPKTVRNLVSVIFDKLGTRTRAETVARARDAGIGPLPQ